MPEPDDNRARTRDQRADLRNRFSKCISAFDLSVRRELFAITAIKNRQ